MKLSPGPSSSGSRSSYFLQNFSPAGLHVLVVDDDPLCLMVLDRMLRQCNYKVTTCNRVNRALALLRENKDDFDLVMSDVYMPDADGFQLLEIIGLELDLPVIMMSANGETSVVMKGITHGACDYLIKPVRMEELRNIWQHVIRKKGKDPLRVDILGESDESGRTGESQEQSSKKRKELVELGDDTIEDISSLKKARVNWSVQLHQQFVSAVNQLGVDKAVPKKLLEIMNVQGLTRENVASHLQKYRLYLKRLSGVVPEPCPIASFQASMDGKVGGTMRVQPGGKNSGSNSSGVKGLNMGAGIGTAASKSRSIHPSTMESLAQFELYQHKQAAANRAQVLGGLGLSDTRPPNTSGGLQRMSSLDLSFFLQTPQIDAASNALDDLAAHSFSSVKLEDEWPHPNIRSERSHTVTEGLLSPWNINPDSNAQNASKATNQSTSGYGSLSMENHPSYGSLTMETIQENLRGSSFLEIADTVSSTTLAHELSPSTPSGEGFSESSFEAGGAPSVMMAGGHHFIENSALDVSDYLLEDGFSYEN